MKIELDTGQSQFSVRAYSERSVTINDRELRQSFLLMPDCLIVDWPPQRPAEISKRDIEQIAGIAPEVVILGTGKTLVYPGEEVLRPLSGSAIGFEVMDTRAACRCFTILASEGRFVLAAILPPDAI